MEQKGLHKVAGGGEGKAEEETKREIISIKDNLRMSRESYYWFLI